MSTRLLALVALLLLASAPVARAWDDEPWDDDAPYGDAGYGDDAYDDPAPSDYEGALSPYGGWYYDPTWGRVWRPSVAAGWMPYSDGRWVWTTWGWTWTSWEPWAWTFHYGRWGWQPAWGWVWVPGTVWGPAWVSWSWGSGYVGWAPLAPFGTVVVNNWFWVNEGNFCNPHVNRVRVHERWVPPQLRGHAPNGYGRPPTKEHMIRVGRDPVQVAATRPKETLAPWTQRPVRGGQAVDGKAGAPHAPLGSSYTTRQQPLGRGRVGDADVAGRWSVRDPRRQSPFPSTPDREASAKPAPVLPRGDAAAPRPTWYGNATVSPNRAGSPWRGGGAAVAPRGGTWSRGGADAYRQGGGAVGGARPGGPPITTASPVPSPGMRGGPAWSGTRVAPMPGGGGRGDGGAARGGGGGRGQGGGGGRGGGGASSSFSGGAGGGFGAGGMR